MTTFRRNHMPGHRAYSNPIPRTRANPFGAAPSCTKPASSLGHSVSVAFAFGGEL